MFTNRVCSPPQIEKPYNHVPKSGLLGFIQHLTEIRSTYIVGLCSDSRTINTFPDSVGSFGFFIVCFVFML